MDIQWLVIWFSVGFVRLVGKIKRDIKEVNNFIVYLGSNLQS